MSLLKYQCSTFFVSCRTVELLIRPIMLHYSSTNNMNETTLIRFSLNSNEAI